VPSPRTAWPDDPAYLKAAFSKLGLKEITGPKHEAQIVAMYAASGHPVRDDETAWCAAFVGWALAQGGLPNTRSLMARSYVQYGRSISVRKPAPRGAIAVWPRGKPPFGHVNFVLADDGEYLTCIGGNQSMQGTTGAVTITRERRANLVALVMPPAPKPIAPPAEEPTPDPEDKMPPLAPAPQPLPPVPAPPSRPWWHPAAIAKNVWTWITGGALGFAWMTDPMAWVRAAIALGAFLLAAALVAWLVSLATFGRARTAAWIKHNILRSDP
jgi:uncharacterized protein (TIGR02594 family)